MRRKKTGLDLTGMPLFSAMEKAREHSEWKKIKRVIVFAAVVAGLTILAAVFGLLPVA